jgi:hypothetical protein
LVISVLDVPGFVQWPVARMASVEPSRRVRAIDDACARIASSLADTEPCSSSSTRARFNPESIVS